MATIRGVEYYNDSKATNVDATIKALESFPANVHLILGGKDKDSDYTQLNDLLRQRVKRVYTIGAAAEKIESQIKGVEVDHSETLETALRRASAMQLRGTSCCWRRPAPASISSRTTNIGAEFLKKSFTPWPQNPARNPVVCCYISLMNQDSYRPFLHLRDEMNFPWRSV